MQFSRQLDFLGQGSNSSKAKAPTIGKESAAMDG